jgi:hypothetical protein
MGWKLTSIIIKDFGSMSDLEIINTLFTTEHKTIEPVSFSECMYPTGDRTIYFGNYKNNLIISTYAFDLVDKFHTTKISKAEKLFIQMFPDSLIGAFSLHSGVNYYAWTILSKGQKVRTKRGDGDNGISCDYGEPLPEELDFLKLSFKTKNDQVSYNWPKKNGETEVLSEDQIGENYVSKIWSMFTGTELFYDETLLETKFRAYDLEPEVSIENTSGNNKNIWQKLFGGKRNISESKEKVLSTSYAYENSLSNIENVYNELQKFDKSLLSLEPPINDGRLEEFERKYGVMLSKEYKTLMKNSNGLSLGGIELLSLGLEYNKASLDHVYNLLLKNLSKFSEDFIPISPDGAGNYYCLDLSRTVGDNCPIIFYQINYDYDSVEEIETCNATLAEFINESFIEYTLEDRDYEGNRKSGFLYKLKNLFK